jgi:hypothetical protein
MSKISDFNARAYYTDNCIRGFEGAYFFEFMGGLRAYANGNRIPWHIKKLRVVLSCI